MLPNDYLKPCVAMIEELINMYEVSAVLCTATQPALDSFFVKKKPIDLCPDLEEQFAFLQRVTYKNARILFWFDMELLSPCNSSSWDNLG